MTTITYYVTRLTLRNVDEDEALSGGDVIMLAEILTDVYDVNY
jgi:hypothetical protein